MQRAGKLGGSIRIMSILDYLITWLDKFHLNVSKAPHTLEHLTVHGEKRGRGREGEIFLLVRNMYFNILHTMQISWENTMSDRNSVI